MAAFNAAFLAAAFMAFLDLPAALALAAAFLDRPSFLAAAIAFAFAFWITYLTKTLLAAALAGDLGLPSA